MRSGTSGGEAGVSEGVASGEGELPVNHWYNPRQRFAERSLSFSFT